jgi:mono/diheme cytochrome c family protein
VGQAVLAAWTADRVNQRFLEQTMLRRLACAVVFVPSLAVAQDAQQGQEIAQRWCSSCHVVDRAATRAPADGLPTFPAIAAKPDLIHSIAACPISP